MSIMFWKGGWFCECNKPNGATVVQLDEYERLMTGLANGQGIEENENGFPILVGNILTNKERESEKNKLERLLLIRDLKSQLQESDYKAIKFVEGQLSATDYVPIKLERQNLRNRIKELESTGNYLKN